MRSFIAACLFVPAFLAADSFHPNQFPTYPKETIRQTDIRLMEADHFFDAGLYSQATPIYQQLLADILRKLSLSNHADERSLVLQAMQCRFHLAQTYFAMKQYKNVIEVLSDNIVLSSNASEDLETLQNSSVYLMALAWKNLKDYPLSASLFSLYLSVAPPFLQPFYDEGRFELGIVYFLWNRWEEAEILLKSLGEIPSKPRLHALAQLYLVRIALAQGKSLKAEHLLKSMSGKLRDSLSDNDPLHFEFSYLQGEVLFQLQNYSKALEFFQNALPKHIPQKSSWYADTLYHLGWCYLKIGEDPAKNLSEQSDDFHKAEETFQQLLNESSEERSYLALGQCLLARAKWLKDENAYAQAEDLLSQQGIFQSHEAKAHALLLRAEAAPSYIQRDRFYRQLTQEANSQSAFYAKGWYMRGLNDFEHGLQLQKGAALEESRHSFERASNAFSKAFTLLKETDKRLAGSAVKYQALAIKDSGHGNADLEAFQLIDDLINLYPEHWQAVNHPDEILYLHGFLATRLNPAHPEKYTPIADRSLKAAAAFPACAFGDIALNHLGAFYYRENDFQSAEAAYLLLGEKFPSSPLCGEAWLRAAACADQLHKDPEISRQRRQKVFEQYPASDQAAEAYFTYYTYQEYLQGDRNAIKHLQRFIEQNAESPFQIEAYYLLGMDYKRDRKTPEGKWIRKKSLTDAIDAFQEAETLYDLLRVKQLIPEKKLTFYTTLRYRAILERALANLAIAEDAQGAKQQIYLEYAEEVFRQLLDDFKQSTTLFQDGSPSIYEESAFGLVQTYLKEKKQPDAEALLSDLIQKCALAKVTRGYYLSRALYEQGKIALNKKDYNHALQLFKQAEDASKGNLLSTDQKLDLWIQQSNCLQGLDQNDNALLILSKVINDDAISTLRLKAMYLRAEIYETQSRPELARKQLDSLARKGGTWALKAKEKLEKQYGY